MIVKASQKNAKISPKKVRFLLDSVKGMSPAKAVDALQYMPHKSARILRAVIKSALANATNNLKLDANLLQFRTLSVDQGNKLKRYRAGGRGTAKPYVHALSHITIELETVKSISSVKPETVRKSEIKKSVEENTPAANEQPKKTAKTADKTEKTKVIKEKKK